MKQWKMIKKDLKSFCKVIPLAPLFVSTPKGRYSTYTLFIKKIMKIHWVLTFQNNLLLLMLIGLASFLNSRNSFKLWTYNAYKFYNRYSSQCIRSTNIAKLVLCAKGQKHPWVVPLRTSHFDFLEPIELWKITRNI
jgi:hypothetical protein